MSESNKMYDIFISYQWGIQEQVAKFHKKLELSTKYKIWRDENALRQSTEGLYDQLAQNINRSKVFLCFLTKKYIASPNCKRELEFAARISKAIIYLMIEKIDVKTELVNAAGFIMGSANYTHCYDNPESWWEDNFEEITNSLQTEIDVYIFILLIYFEV